MPDPVSALLPGRSESGPACSAWCAVSLQPALFPKTVISIRQCLWAGRVCHLRLCGGSVARAGKGSRSEPCAGPPSAFRSDSAAGVCIRGHAHPGSGEIDITKNLINWADSGLATHPVQRKTTGAICPEKSNKNNQQCFSTKLRSPTRDPFGLRRSANY